MSSTAVLRRGFLPRLTFFFASEECFCFFQGLPGPPGEKGENGDVGQMVSVAALAQAILIVLRFFWAQNRYLPAAIYILSLKFVQCQ